MSKAWLLTAALVAMGLSVSPARAQSDLNVAAAKTSQGEPARDPVGARSTVARLEGVKVENAQQGIAIEMTTSSPITPTLTTINDPTRLVMDFPDTISACRENRIAVNRDGVIAVRIGVQPVDPPVTRVVLDLDQPRNYQLVNEASKLIVKLGEPSVWDSSPADSNQDVSKPVSDSEKDKSGAEQANPIVASNTEADPTGSHTEVQPAISISGSPAPAKSDTAASVNAPALPASAKEQSELAVRPAASESAAQDNPQAGQATPAATTENASSAKPVSAPTQAANAPTNAPDPAPANPDVHPATAVAGNAAGTEKQIDPPSNTNISPVTAPPIPASPKSSTPPANAAPAKAELVADSKAPHSALELTNSVTKEASNQNLSDEYVIGEQDVLAITVWREPELSGVVVVRPDGKITVPLVNELRVVGLTPVQLQALLTEKLKPFVNVPQVTVSVRQINSRNVYLIGEAAREGSFSINSSTTVLQLIAEAGGLKDFAKRKSIYVIRKVGEKQMRYPFNYDDVIRGKNTKQNIVLQPGDMVVVP